MSINKIINFKENVPSSVKNALNKIGNNTITKKGKDGGRAKKSFLF